MKSIILTAAEVRHALAEGKGVLRRKVDWTNSTVLGYPAKSYWPGLLFEHAEARDDNPMLAIVSGKYIPGRDVHLSIPYREGGGDEHWDIADLGRYRVRPKFEAGDWAWVKEKWQDFCPIWDGAWCGCGSKQMQAEKHQIAYEATETGINHKELRNVLPSEWREAKTMPKRASRLTLEWTAISVAQADEWEWELEYKVAGGG